MSRAWSREAEPALLATQVDNLWIFTLWREMAREVMAAL
ncbi:hypothetical protein Q427_07880 [Halomonas sp. BC04]|nr:hypothetical protein Q427_07880 [Halomonas sp. BC04]